MARVRTRELARWAAEIRDHSVWFAENCNTLSIRANSDLDDGLTGIRYDRQRSSRYADDGSIPGPTPAWTLARRDDETERLSAEMIGRMQAAVHELGRAREAAVALLPLAHAEAEKLASRGDLEAGTYSAQCANVHCGVLVAGTPNDRLRAGRCEPCYRYRLAHNSQERPQELCHPEREAEAV